MALDVSPTRMELLKLKRKLGMAKRGHQLLKDKLDELVRIMIILVNEAARLRPEADRLILGSRALMDFAGYSTFHEAGIAAMYSPGGGPEVETALRPLLNLRIPHFKIPGENFSPPLYGFAQTTAALDESSELFADAVKKLIELAAKEKEIMMVADEIEKTRRRVNALEYILIPDISETIKFISMKIEETERNTLVRLMRIKDIVRAPVSYSSAYPGVQGLPPPE